MTLSRRSRQPYDTCEFRDMELFVVALKRMGLTASEDEWVDTAALGALLWIWVGGVRDRAMGAAALWVAMKFSSTALAVDVDLISIVTDVEVHLVLAAEWELLPRTEWGPSRIAREHRLFGLSPIL